MGRRAHARSEHSYSRSPRISRKLLTDLPIWPRRLQAIRGRSEGERGSEEIERGLRTRPSARMRTDQKDSRECLRSASDSGPAKGFHPAHDTRYGVLGTGY